jgi:hypothetical protein
MEFIEMFEMQTQRQKQTRGKISKKQDKRGIDTRIFQMKKSSTELHRESKRRLALIKKRRSEKTAKFRIELSSGTLRDQRYTWSDSNPEPLENEGITCAMCRKNEIDLLWDMEYVVTQTSCFDIPHPEFCTACLHVLTHWGRRGFTYSQIPTYPECYDKAIDQTDCSDSDRECWCDSESDDDGIFYWC